MSDAKRLAQLVAATRGGLGWLAECGEDTLWLPDDFVMPKFDGVGTNVLPEQAQSAADGPGHSPEASTPNESAALRALAQATRRAPDDRSGASAVPPARAPTHRPTSVQPTIGPVRGSEMAQRAADLFTLNEQMCEAISLPVIPGGPKIEWVFGHGHPGARLMFVADGPRAADNEVGMPFVGDDGRLLSRMVHAMGLSRSDVHVCYIVPYYDPRTDADAMFDACAPFFAQRVDIVQPEVIVVFGESAARHLSGRSDAFPHLRGQWFEYRERPLLPTFHPEVLMQMPKGKAHVWQDLKAVMRFMGLTRSGTPS
ncbi:MAG: uracil-DNA glycosylase [Myxococcota bacterium]|nr:uracil-DNA glycosylase [Myxococcota bacterium]